ncbi:MAG: 2-oxoacid:acceptor oxidoreductase subunit alpha [Chloroflexi bacterium]|nr:2-oxoacid:acceptor oxidoreductase subunit alpha [Chloroflexota bacterium]
MSEREFDYVLAIGGEAGQGIATPGDILARIFIRRGLHLSTYNAYQSLVRGGHIFLFMRVSDQKVYTHGDKLDTMLCLNQDTMDRHLELMEPGSSVVYNADTIVPGESRDGVQMVGLPIADLTQSRNRLLQNTVAVGSIMALMGEGFDTLQESLTLRFQRYGDEVVSENIRVAQAGYDYAGENFTAYPTPLPRGPKPLAVWAGNDALAMGGAAAGVKFYVAYPMSPSTGVLHWMAQHARDLGIMVRQVEDEISVANMAIGASHAGARAMTATSGGGFALMTEAIGAAGMMEIPVVFIDVQRGGPSTGLPTKTEQGDLWQALGASQGDFQKFIVAPKDAVDAYNTVPELFNLVDKYQCPGMILSDLLISEGRYSFDPDEIDMQPEINRGALITEPSESNGYKRYENTESGISTRARAGLEGFVHVVASDEHDEDSILLSDEYTNPHKRRKMVEKRHRKMSTVLDDVAAPELEGPEDADVTLIGWGSTYGVIHEALEILRERGISANHLPIKWIIPFHVDVVTDIVNGASKTLVVENNHSGQFYRYMRSETGVSVDGHIRKYDGEPFAPHHIVEGVIEHLASDLDVYVPTQEVMV